jgi:transposase
VLTPVEFENSTDGFFVFIDWLQKHDIHPQHTILCMEATGVYGEGLAYFARTHEYPIAVEPPLKVKRAFMPTGHKNDSVDSQQIAEYSYRFHDELHLWQPREEILEQIKVLLSTREQFSSQCAAHQTSLRTLKRKVVSTPLAEALHEQSIARIKKQIKEIDKEIQRLIDQDPKFGQMIHLLTTIPGVGLLLAANILLVMQSSPDGEINHKKMAAYIGICPYEKRSGKSVYKPSTSRHYGPARIRKLLYLASMSMRTHHPMFRKYYHRKIAEGKPSKVVLNNIANKLLKIMCAVVRSNTPFLEGFRSVHPALLR